LSVKMAKVNNFFEINARKKLGLCEGEIRNHPAVEKGFFEQDTISDLV